MKLVKIMKLLLFVMIISFFTGCAKVNYFVAKQELAQSQEFDNKILYPLKNLLLNEGFEENQVEFDPRFYGITYFPETYGLTPLASFTKYGDCYRFIDVYVFETKKLNRGIAIYPGAPCSKEKNRIKTEIEALCGPYIQNEQMFLENSVYIFLN